MSVRGVRVLLAGACSTHGIKLTEAFLALGAQVVAADRLRTRLEELRAQLQQHERLWIAESDVAELNAADRLFADVARDEPIDVALLVLPDDGSQDLWTGDAPPIQASLRALPACAWFLRAALKEMSVHGRGRVLVLTERCETDLQRALVAATAELVDSAASIAAPRGIIVAGFASPSPTPALLERVLALVDPALAPTSGWCREH